MPHTLISVPNDLIPFTLCLDDQGVPVRGWFQPLEEAAEEMLQAGRAFVEKPCAHFAVGEQLLAYFSGERVDFDTPIDPRGTAFQKRIWAEMARIPYGQAVSYGELAHRAGCRAYRAVGQACHRNPLPILVPCHRVIASGGRLGGYGGGEDIKRMLLRLEGVTPMPVG